MARIKTYGTGSRCDEGGFTLLELLVVVSIAVLVAMLSVPLFSNARNGADLHAGTRDVAAALRLARSEAIRRNSQVPVVFDVNRRTVRAAEDTPRRLSDGLSIALVSAQSEIVSGTVGSIRFYPDGSSTGGAVRLTAADGDGREARIHVDWLSGRVTVSR